MFTTSVPSASHFEANVSSCSPTKSQQLAFPDLVKYCLLVLGVGELSPSSPLGVVPQDFIKIDVFHPVIITRLCLQ